MYEELKRQGLSKKDIIFYLEEENKELRKMLNLALNLSTEHTKDKEIVKKELIRRIQKAIKYIENSEMTSKNYTIKILKGEDNE